MSTITVGEEVDTGNEIELREIERRSGLYILGKPGMGKSNFIENAVTSDIFEII